MTEMGILYPLIALAILSIAAHPAETKYIAKFNGSERVQDYTYCYLDPSVRYLKLSCAIDEYVRVTAATVSRDYQCLQNSSCQVDLLESIADDCEGKIGECFINLPDSNSTCSSVNRVDVSFQCIDVNNAHEMCPSAPTTEYHNGSTYYLTPQFSSPPLTYRSNMNCECTVSGEGIIELEVLYLNVDKTSSSSACTDYISFMDEGKYCTTTDQQGQPIKKTYNRNAMWRFVTDNKYTSRGGWLKVTGSQGEQFQVACSQSLPTTPGATTTKKSPNVGGIVGGLVGGLVPAFMIIIIAVVVSHKKRCRSKKSSVNNAQQNPQKYAAHSGPNSGQAEGNASPPTNAKGASGSPPPPYTV